MLVLQGDFPGSLFSASYYKYKYRHTGTRYSAVFAVLNDSRSFLGIFNSILNFIPLEYALSTDSLNQGLWLENGLI